jgi:methionyl aminopeptidase
MRDHAQNRVLGPNDACWCGSGRKFKKCHMGREERAIQQPAASRNPLILDEAERNGMRKAARVNAELLDTVRDMIRPGLSTAEINSHVHAWTIARGHTPATLGYRNRRGLPDFPSSCCTSPNHVVCHGIPGDYVIQDGDIINVDLTTIVDGWHGDQSETFMVGAVSDDALELVQCSFDSMWAAIDAIKPYSKVIEIGRVISQMAKQRGFSVVKEYQGHGVGRLFHQKPHIPHFPDAVHGQAVIEPGMCFTIEPMINAGTWKTVLDRRDGWTVYTADGKLSAQFEHTILMTESGPEVMTLTKRGPKRGHKFAAAAAAVA